MQSQTQIEVEPDMNEDQRQGRIDEWKAKIKQEWGKLTDDEVTEAEGNFEELTAKIQQKYGDAKEDIARKLNEMKEGDSDEYK